ncbi:MAG: chemotaxis protein CheW [Rhodospirillaceae bacterium]|jgi:purine-binding chemotaxis protein CheW|nr:chemotaxis protein CheW [Rhodospirillaceae bacterium]
MSQALATTDNHDLTTTHPGKDLEDFVTFFVEEQMFGIPVLKVQDILTPEHIASIPLAPAEVRGSINLRGRIVTVIDVRVRLGLKPKAKKTQTARRGKGMGVTVEHGHDLYTLLVDRIGDVMGLANDLFEKNPATLDLKWREFSLGVYRLEKNLLVVLDIERLLNLPRTDGRD